MVSRKSLLPLLVLVVTGLVLMGCSTAHSSDWYQTDSLSSVSPDATRVERVPPVVDWEDDWDEEAPNWRHWAD